MNKDLLASQFAALEEPHENTDLDTKDAGSGIGENAEVVTADATETPEQIVEEVLAAFGL